MSETKWTPGPWFVHDDHPDHACYHIAPFGYQPCTEAATVFSPGNPEADANAHLIAAAPDLYDALQNLLSRLANDADGHAWFMDEQEASIIALSKARGES